MTIKCNLTDLLKWAGWKIIPAFLIFLIISFIWIFILTLVFILIFFWWTNIATFLLINVFEAPWYTHLNRICFLQGVRIVNLYFWIFNTCEKVATITELHSLAVSYVDIFIMLKLIMQNMMHPDFINETGCHVVPTRMNSDGNQWFSCFSYRHVFKDKVFSGHLTLVCLIVPQSDCTIFLRACQDQWSLHCYIHRWDLSWVEAFTYKVEFDFFVRVFIQTNWFC